MKTVYENLAFEITNELLNQSLIMENAQPSQIESIIMQVLKVNLVTTDPKIHIEKRIFFDIDDDGSLCGRYDKELRLTTIEVEVTCKSCLQCLKIRSEGRGYTLTGGCSEDLIGRLV